MQDELEPMKKELLNFSEEEVAVQNAENNILAEECDEDDSQDAANDTQLKEVDRSEYESVEELYDGLSLFLGKRGITVSKSVTAQLVSAMVSSKLIFVTSDDMVSASAIVKSLGDFVGGDSLVKKTNIFPVKEWQKGKIGVTVVSPDNVEKLFTLSSDWIQFFTTNSPSVQVRTVDGMKLLHSDDKYFVLLPSEDSLSLVPQSLAAYSAFVRLSFEGETSSFEKEGESNKILTVLSYNKLIRITKEVNYLSEEYWRKFDLFLEKVKITLSNQQYNKLFIRMETFISLYLAEVNNRDSAFDYAIADIFLPAVTGYRQGFSFGTNSMRYCLEECFGSNMTQCNGFLKMLNIK